MTRRDPTIALEQMLEYARKARRISSGRTREDLARDELLQLGLTRAIEVIGEAANRIPAEIRETIADIPWKQIIGTRNRLIHVYDGIDYNVLWDTIQDDLPPLISQLETLLKELH